MKDPITTVFNRKNKTLRSVLMTRSVLKLLEENRNTVRSLQQPSSSTTTTTTSATTSRTDHRMVMAHESNERTIPEIMEDILEQEQWRNQRASKLDLDDFLSLLVEFNSHGIHFS